MTQWDYLHLTGLRRGLLAGFRLVGAPGGPVLDLFCGTKPYLELIPWRPIWGVDLDDHFGRADVFAEPPLPFRDDAFGLVLCSQALHLVDDPVATVGEMSRVVRPGGHAVVTIPHLFVAEGSFERRWGEGDLRALFAGWENIRIAGLNGPGAAVAFAVGRITMRVGRRWRFLAPLLEPGVVAMNVLCGTLDVLSASVRRRWPHSLVLVARRPSIARPSSGTT
jgi:SAM-dependent methyltransferase